MSDEDTRPPLPRRGGLSVGIVVAAVLLFVLRDLDLWLRIAIAFVAIAVTTWLSLVLAHRRR